MLAYDNRRQLGDALMMSLWRKSPALSNPRSRDGVAVALEWFTPRCHYSRRCHELSPSATEADSLLTRVYEIRGWRLVVGNHKALTRHDLSCRLG